ncbi:hypothetical protein J6590_063546 [Homalodisca vitripennis]|nr:hypothetical protein J6590_063546 [Homalodisca vitripennis]
MPLLPIGKIVRSTVRICSWTIGVIDFLKVAMTTKMNLELPITHNSSDPNEDCLMVAGNFTLSWHNVSVWVKKKSVEKSTWFRQHYQDVRILNKGK